MTEAATPRQPLPRTGLTRVKVVDRGIQLADSEGMPALSMRRLAAELSVTPMALYWHFASKDALLDAMAERVATGLHYEDDRAVPWQSRLHGVLAANLAAFRAHPWLPPLVKGRIITAPAYLDILEALLDAVRLAGFGPVDGVRVAEFAMDGVAAIADTLALRDSPRRPPASPEHLAAYRQNLASAVTNHPRILEALLPLTEDEDPERYASLALRVLVAGIEAGANENPATSSEVAGSSL